jgi:hypothetical protein
MPDIRRKFLSLGYGLGVFFDAEKFNIIQIPLARKRLGKDATKTKLIKFGAVEIQHKRDEQIIDRYAALDYHAASGDEAKDLEQREDELAFLGEQAEELRARGLKRVVITGDFNQAAYKERAGIAKGTGTLPEHFEIDSTRLFNIAKQLMGTNLVLQAITTPKYIVRKQRVGANIPINSQGPKGGVPGNPKEVDLDSKTLYFELVERPVGMTQDQAEEHAKKIIGDLTVPNTPNFVREFGPNDFTDGSDHAPLVPAQVNDETIGAHALIGTAGMTGNVPSTELFIRELTNPDLDDQHLATIKLEEILTRKLLSTPNPEIESIRKQLSEIDLQKNLHTESELTQQILVLKNTPHVEDLAEFLHFPNLDKARGLEAQLPALQLERQRHAELTAKLLTLKTNDLALADLETTYFSTLSEENKLAFKTARAELDKLDADTQLHSITKYIKFIKEHAHGGPLGDYLLKADKDRILLKQGILEWVNTPEYKKMASLFKGKKGWEECLEDDTKLNAFLKGIKKDPITEIGQKIDRQPSAGYKPTKGSPREDQFLSLSKESAAICFVTEAGDLTQEMIDLRNPKLRGHLNAYSDMRDTAEVTNLRSYLNGLPADIQAELHYSAEEKEGEKPNLAETLKNLRMMVLKTKLFELNLDYLAFTARAAFFNPQFNVDRLLQVPEIMGNLFGLALNNPIQPDIIKWSCSTKKVLNTL